MNQAVQIAIVGNGLVGRRHADATAHVEGVTLSSIVDPSPAGRSDAARRNVACFETLEALFDAQAPDGIILATPTSLHVQQSQEIIRQGCPVLIEKPLATSAAAAAILVSEADRAGIPILVGHHRRYNPLIQRAHEIVTSGEIGDVRALHVNCWFYKPDHYFDQAPWRKSAGAGPISVNLAHDVDLMRHLCGEVDTVQAQSTPSARGFENEDVAGAVLRFCNGAIGTITVSDSIVAPWSWELTSNEYPIYPPTAESCYLIGGSHGSLSVPDLRLWSHQGAQRDWWTPISATTLTRGASDPLVNQMSHFADVIRGTKAPIVSGWEGLRTLQVLEAIQDACKSGETVQLNQEQPIELQKETEVAEKISDIL